MIKYILKRIIVMIPMMFIISIVSFIIINAAPGDAADMYLDPERLNDTEYVNHVRESLGLNKSVFTRYFIWLKGILKGDFGYSFKSRLPVLQEIKSRLWISVTMAVFTLIIQYTIGLSLGMFCAKRQYKASDYCLTTLALVGLSVPSFWLSTLLVFIFCSLLNWLPATGLYTIGFKGSDFAMFIDRVKHLILPMICVSIGGIGGKLRIQRASYLDVMNQDYIRTARSKGVSERRLTWVHAFKNSSLPIVTGMSGILSSVLGGSFVIESIFGIPGMGRLGTNAVMNRDYPVIMGTLLISSLLVMVGILITDLLYVVFDPRIKL